MNDAGALITMLLLQALLIGVIGLVVYVSFARLQAHRDFQRQQGAEVRASASDIIYGAVALVIWLFFFVGVSALIGSKPAMLGRVLVQRPFLSLLLLAVLCYGGLRVAFAFRRGAHDIRTAYREGKR